MSGRDGVAAGGEATRLLQAMREGDAAAPGRLMSLVYDELRALAGAFLRRQPEGITLQPTALVHEAYVRLVDRTTLSVHDQVHFRALCATVMRGVLADHARRRNAAKRGGDWHRLSMSGLPAHHRPPEELDVLALDEALHDLAALHPRQARIVECRFFGGMTVNQVADLLEVSTFTVEADWRMARAWLGTRLTDDGRGS